ERDKLVEHLSKQAIFTSSHYPRALHLQPCYAELGYKEGSMPASERAAREAINLPIFPTMTKAQQDRVAAAVLEFFKD
ncbi:MAG: DegT/DnrJ/EryC1/StrS family aminotransferase, partial [Verrucomicrobiota bacterium]